MLSQSINVRSDLNPTVDLFAQGLDRWVVHCFHKLMEAVTEMNKLFHSLSATYLRNRLISALRRSSEPGMQEISSLITQNIIFENPTMRSLARKVAAFIKGADGTSGTSGRNAHIKAIGAMIQKYSADFQSSLLEGPSKHPRIDGGRVVLLTGSTGTLGSYMLADLLGRPEISTIYVLNRFSTASGTYSSRRQHNAFEERGLSTRLLFSAKKVFYLEGDISQDGLGLATCTYERVCSLCLRSTHN